MVELKKQIEYTSSVLTKISKLKLEKLYSDVLKFIE